MEYVLCNGKTAEGEKRDFCVSHGRIQEPDKTKEPEQVIDVNGCMVLPGLIDTHMHANQLGDYLGTNADVICLTNGVTTAIDAGSCGINGIENLIRVRIPQYTVDIKCLINIVSSGQLYGTVYEETPDPRFFDRDAILEAFRKYPGTCKGLKIRSHENCTKSFGLKAVEQTVETARAIEKEGYHCPVIVHLGDLGKTGSLKDLLEILRPGDIIAHVFQDNGETILKPDGTVKECVTDARERGILFDLGQGKRNFAFSVMLPAFREGFYPDMLGTDLNRENRYTPPAMGLTGTMTMVYAAGMPFQKIAEAVTKTPCRVYRMSDVTSQLNVGEKADIAVLKQVEKEICFTDKNQDRIKAESCFVPVLTMKEGKVVYRQSFFI